MEPLEGSIKAILLPFYDLSSMTSSPLAFPVGFQNSFCPREARHPGLQLTFCRIDDTRIPDPKFKVVHFGKANICKC